MKNLLNRIRNQVLPLLKVAIITIVLGAVLCSLFPPLPAGSAQVSASSAALPQLREDFPEVEAVSSSDQGIVLDISIPPLVEAEVRQEGTVYQRLSLPESGTTTEIGRPELPAFGRFVAFPPAGEVRVEVVADAVETRTGYLVYPVQEPLIDQGGEEPEFVIDLASYQRDEYYPSRIVELEGPAVIRGVEVMLIRFYPIQYNAARRELRVHSNFRVRVSFVGGAEFSVDERLRSPYFESLLSNILLNYSELGPPPAERFGKGSRSANGCDFLIITPPDFLNQANHLADWKIRRGIDAEVRTTTQTGSTAVAIRSYIQNAYDTWNPAPSFVLFLGDAEFIPTNYETVHPREGTSIGTDLYYATVDGSDFLPDISTARISVDTGSQAWRIINKTIGYERNPTSSSTFYSEISVAGYFQDDEDDGRADRWFIQTSEEIRDYLLTEGYNVQRIYTTYSSDPQWYRDGTSIPAELRKPAFPWDGDSADITNAVNAGRLILNHRDHGWRQGWGDPYYDTVYVNGLTNGDKLPVVFSMNCQTGWFDNETDDPADDTHYGAVHFAEAWQRNSNGGAAGIIGAARISYSGYNDHLTKGFYDGIWPDFLSYTPSPSPFSAPQYRMGQVLNYGKLHLAAVYGTGIYTQLTFEMFHYFGDPTMEIWTGFPQDLTVSHLSHYYAGATSYAVTVEQDGALVSLVKDGEILGTAFSSGGSATINFSSPLTLGPMYVTVTKHNYRPYEATVTVADMTHRQHLAFVTCIQ